MGTGTSQGVPVIGAENCGLDLSNPKNWRTRSSIHVEIAKKRVQVDASPEFRLQCLKNNISFADLFILTHGHADHICGMDDLRRFCDKISNNILPVYSNEYGIERIRAMFPYALGEKPRERGYPCFKVAEMPAVMELSYQSRIYAESLPHGPVETLGLVFEENGKRFAYYTDCKALTARAEELAKNADVLVLDCLRPKMHSSHMCVDEALSAIEKLCPKHAYLTHTTSHLDYEEFSKTLPQNCFMAYDGLVVEV